jgi:hypothetical protein
MNGFGLYSDSNPTSVAPSRNLGYRPRWHIENDGYRELKEGWGLEEQR